MTFEPMSKKDDILVKIGDLVRKKAKAKFKSNVEFANVADVNEATIRRILQGEQNLSIKILKKVCQALEVKVSDLLRETGI
ncbi:MAG: hypothetical protein POELPBGB_00924 [Bacteroidia bacterium]|nr:hypothetical protein [Bacteroidia bacterium]